jgi:hypothetical protein
VCIGKASHGRDVVLRFDFGLKFLEFIERILVDMHGLE